jgi:suppressor for copper-sensitivity B
MPMKILNKYLLVLVCALGAGVAAAAPDQGVNGASAWVYGDYGQIRLVSASNGVDEQQNVQIGVQMRLRKGWKTYWRTPGESGIPPNFDWGDSQNVALGEPAWPTPTRLSEFGAEAFGYKQEVIFPVMATREDPAEAMQLDLVMSYGVCKDICMPVTTHMALSLPATDIPAQRTQHARHIERFARKVPQEEGAGGLSVSSLRMVRIHDQSAIEVTLEGTKKLKSPDVALELTAEYRQLAPRIVLAEGGQRAIVTVPIIMDADAPPLIGQHISVVAWDGAGLAVEGVLPVRR